ncbi:hypothetical protein IMT09_05980 [Burkholderia cepacia]|uniref:hypothetical protein n=1 Tax=Burkholderia cepacia TaxID=292 RepID=UPI0018671F04|nr:hypothetical protein [Burkholderia cepacia]MBE2967659.1 hypothetical protein [Burkholderia cepacia]
MATVSTKEQLERAKENKEPEIVIVGELADKFAKSKKIATLSGVALAGIVAVVGLAAIAAPETAGLSLGFAAAPVAAMSGMEIAAIIAAATIGIGLIIAICKDYEEVECGNGKLVLKRKSK